MNRLDRMSWHKVKLGDYITILTDYHANGSYKILKKNVELLDEPDYAVMIRTTNFEKQDFSQDLKYISKHAYEFLGKSKVKPGDILMNKIANAGSVYYMPDLHCPVSLGMNLFLIRTDPNKTNQRYAYYYLKTNENYVKLFATGTAAKTITKEAVRQLDISLPPIDVQHKIVSILSAYDDLIENNLRRIKILEEMAQSLYREWFVKFRFPGHKKVRMMNSPLGKIPEEWEVCVLSDLVDFVKGVEPGSKNYQSRCGDGMVPFLRVGDLGKRESAIFVNCELVNDRVLTPEDIAVTMDGTIGLVRIGLQGAYSSGIRRIVIRKPKRIGWAFVYQLLQSEYIQAIIHAHAKGTTIKHASSSIDHMIFALPNSNLVENFEKDATPLLKQALCLARRNEVLECTRDLLLPKLISGELDVSEVDITIPEASA